MPIAWYIVLWKRKDQEQGLIRRTCAIRDYSTMIKNDGGNWRAIEVLGGRLLVKVKASTATLSLLDTKFKRLPKDRLDDSLSDLPSNIKTMIKNEILDMGYTLSEIQQKLGSNFNQKTLREVLKFMATRRRKPRYDKATDTIFCDGDIRACNSIEVIDKEVQ